MNARIPALSAPYAEDVSAHFSRLMPPGMEPLKLFRTVAHNTRVLGRMRRGGLLDKGSITTREREIMILRTCARCGSEYEWGVHVAFFGPKAGFTQNQVHATRMGTHDDPSWTPQEQLLIQLADQLHDSSQVSDDLWARLSKHWQPAQLIELMMLAGLYHAVSYLTNGLRLDQEAGTPRFPDSTVGVAAHSPAA